MCWRGVWRVCHRVFHQRLLSLARKWMGRLCALDVQRMPLAVGDWALCRCTNGCCFGWWQATGIEIASLQVVAEGEEPEPFWDLFRLG